MPTSPRPRSTTTSPPRTTSSSRSWISASNAGCEAGYRPRRDGAPTPPKTSYWRSSTSMTSGFTATTTRPARSSTCCSNSAPPTPPARPASQHLANLRSIVHGLADQANLEDPDGFTRSWYILMKGSIVAAAEGYTDAAKRAKSMATRLIEDHRPPHAASQPGRDPKLTVGIQRRQSRSGGLCRAACSARHTVEAALGVESAGVRYAFPPETAVHAAERSMSDRHLR